MAQSLRIAILIDPIATGTNPSEHAPELARELLARGHTVRGFGAAGSIPRSGTPAPIPGDSAGRGVKAFQPDVVLAYGGLSPAAWRGARLARSLEIPLVLVEAGNSPTAGAFARGLRWTLERLWGGYVRRSTSAVLALDPVAAEQAQREGFTSAQIQILAHGVDVNLFRPGLSSAQVLQHGIGGRVLLCVGPLEKRRGPAVLVHAFARTVGQRGDWSLVFAGEGSELFQLRALAGRLGVSDRVHFLSPRPEELPGLMSHSTLIAVPALDDSARGRQLARALACGRAVIVSDLPRLRHLIDLGTRERVAPERGKSAAASCGLIATPGDVESWTDALQRAASSPQARTRWQARSRAIALEFLAWPVVSAAAETCMLRAREQASVRATAAEPLSGRG
jgi:glycosyltransferase involved in cell wall biosynthesis